ncbi:two-component regulator propeller domain-containing protein [uncultured Lutibacter sp.]|uniref:two-component regulator propeller domain-containing protein n=1 Tax=uncultured Lutibacter sp. TaxID=437739 RepID=UPI0026341119|nr:two-component regulator propeller domain-containing protein [uncultured Lutibacter sp.]
MLNIFKKIALILTFLICANIKAQELPPIENFSPLNYSGGNQNWAISQSDENYIYIANNSGLLEFNGEKWNLYPSPNNTILRSVNVVKNRVYTGCYMEFGFWEKNEFGVLDYTSLSNTLKEDLIEDEQFWKILELDKWILFQSLNRIYIYNTLDKSFKIINSKTPITKAFNIEGIIYFQKINDGVYKVENGEVLPISTNEIFKNNIVVNIFKVKAKLLLQTQQKGFYFIDEDGETKWNIEFNKILEASSVYSSIKLEDDSFILGTISNGIYHIDSQGNLINQINQEVGLNNNTVLSIFQDKDQNIWLGLDNGISVVNFSSPFKVFNDVKGKLGSVYTSVIFNDYLYLGTNQGLFYKKLNSNTTFNFIKGTNGQVWSLAIYDNTLFCGHDIGTYIIKNNQAKLISDVQGTWDIKPIPTQENLLIQGNYNGLNILEKVNDSWRFKNKITGFDISSKFFVFSETHQLFVSHEYKGVFKLVIDKKFEKVVEINEETSVTKGLKSGLVSYDNNLYYSSEKGVFKYSKDKHFFELDSLFTNQFFKNDSYYSGKLITNSQTNTLWGFLDKSIVYFSPGILNNTLKINRIPLPESKRRDIADNVEFISLSIDTEKAWKKYFEKNEVKGKQLQIYRNELSDYMVVSIPRFFVIDKDQKIVDVFAPWPSSGKLEEMINNILNK